MTRFSGLLATAALLAGAAPALAAGPTVAQGEARALILRPLSFVRVADLDFGTVISSSAAGVVTINATTGARSILGTLVGMPGELGGRGYFAGAGSGGQEVDINLIPATELTNGLGDTIPVIAMGIDGGTTRQIHLTNLTFYVGVGGSIFVAANQPDGDYESNFDITAEYQ